MRSLVGEGNPCDLKGNVDLKKRKCRSKKQTPQVISYLLSSKIVN